MEYLLIVHGYSHCPLSLSPCRPGGFSALSSMYRNLQEPLMDATLPQETPTQRNTTTRSSGQSAGATGAAMPNPWGSTSTTTPTNNPSVNPPTTTTNPWGALDAVPNPWNSSSIASSPQAGVGVPNPQQMEQTLAMLENPMIHEMMDQMISAFLSQNPMMQQMQRDNPHMASIMSSPEFMRTMMNPQVLRSMMQLQQSMGGMGSSTMPPSPMSTTTTTTTMPPPGSLDFTNLLNQFQSTGLQSHHYHPQQQQRSSPADRFRIQLESLRDMGFDDEMANVIALEQNHGNLNRAVDFLLMNPTPSTNTGETTTTPTNNGDTTATSPTSSSSDENVAESTNETTTQDNDVTTTTSKEPKNNVDKKND
jgi:ubiquilin